MAQPLGPSVSHFFAIMDRAALLALIKAKDAKESEIRALVETLPPGVPAVAASRNDLVDSEGFPRGDIDVHQVRIVRNQIARMRLPVASCVRRGARRVDLNFARFASLCVARPAGCQFDHKELMRQIEQGMEAMHSQSRDQVPTSWRTCVNASRSAMHVGVCAQTHVLMC
jgi:hypothetical protein